MKNKSLEARLIEDPNQIDLDDLALPSVLDGRPRDIAQLRAEFLSVRDRVRPPGQ